MYEILVATFCPRCKSTDLTFLAKGKAGTICETCGADFYIITNPQKDFRESTTSHYCPRCGGRCLTIEGGNQSFIYKCGDCNLSFMFRVMGYHFNRSRMEEKYKPNFTKK